MSEQIPINPALLVWARERAGLSRDEATEKFRRFPEWEAGESGPTYPQLEQLADVLKVPIAVFFFPEPPNVPSINETFRTLPEAELERLPSRIRLLMRKAKAMQLNLIELTEGRNPAERLITRDIHFAAKVNITEMATAVREYIGVSLQQQRATLAYLCYFSTTHHDGRSYYYVGGDSMDEVISGYRRLTGKSVMLPKWAYGYWQSRQRYETQEQIVGVVEEYRKRGLGLDNIVQDWFYWPENQWGCHCFDPERFPDPQAMVDKVHALDARLMISVWPKFYPGTDNYKQLARIGAVYERNILSGDKDWVGPGYLSTFYDPYNAKAREIYWRQMQERLGVLGIDAWWMDATEPDMHSNLSLKERA
jgi:transcriptional regulator with XRE-family HTH domain